LIRCSQNNAILAPVVITAIALLVASAAEARAQTTPAKPSRQFVTFSVDFVHSLPLDFGAHPVADLVGRSISDGHYKGVDYQSKDGQTTVNVLEYARNTRGIGVTVYPFGLSVGPTLGIRGSIEALPVTRLAIHGPSLVGSSYVLDGARAYDVSALLYVSDRAPGWGLGSHAFLGGGIGKIHSTLGNGQRYFAEGGGGINVGPVGVQLSVKFAHNALDLPVPHTFITIPVTVRATLGF
jgi:hypothetical protein